MDGKMIDIIEDIGRGLNTEQLAQKPSGKGDEKDERNQSAAGKPDEADRK